MGTAQMKYTLNTLLTCTLKLYANKLITEKELETMKEIHRNAIIKDMEVHIETKMNNEQKNENSQQ